MPAELTSADPLALPDGVPLSEGESGYVAAARAANTLRAYRSDWAEWCTWCSTKGVDPFAGDASAISQYLVGLAQAGASVRTMSRRLSALRFAFRSRDMADPTTGARVTRVWEGIRRTHGAPPDQAAPLMPPELLDVLAACPATRTWRTRGRPPEPDLAGARDRAVLLVGFVGALRRSELVAMDLEHLADHDNGLVLSIPRSKTNQEGAKPELVVLPLGQPCPLPGARHTRVDGTRRHQLGPAAAARVQGQQGPAAALGRRGAQPPGPGGSGPGRHRPVPLLRPFLASRLCHLRPPAGCQRPGHCPPEPPPLVGHTGAVREGSRGLAGQRGDSARSVGRGSIGHQDVATVHRPAAWHDTYALVLTRISQT